MGCHVGANVRTSAKWDFAILSMYLCKFYISPLFCILTNLQIENELSRHENKQEKTIYPVTKRPEKLIGTNLEMS